MKKYLFLFLLFPLSILAQKNFTYKKDFDLILKESKDKKSDLYYPNLLAKYNKIDSTLTDKEMLAMLISYTEDKNYKPYQDFNFGRKLYKLNEESKFAEVIKTGDAFLAKHPFDLKTLFEVSYAYHQTNKQQEADNYLQKAGFIFGAMFYSGDGMTIENPAFALNPSDGQDFIRKFIGAGIGTMGSGRDENGYFMDMLEAKFDNGETHTLYFIIPHATKKMFVK
ncbi:DUF4919 domain-containing protein [Kaistella flava (ex Peng et al. 2021)]|uniref:DUF4919 domain-containing protein n=1 Tax=Kaistella flava (ex Peng et al. 2021) TaxID=2038776 RepID=A0A7M2Y815_9FLAO|nr:DUF4919 domain-containing protein [Kaistella flava (ex Peng et al. 2021)]QOW10246.1 DUF4919 domain-containing protein [Kaistella flava (ex Peng et al. 2021)]